MKRNIFLALAAAVVMLFSSCSKDIDLVGTTWKADTYTQNITYMGMQASITMDFTLKFTDATNYTMDESATVTIMGQSQSQNDSSTGTYTFDGENGVFDGEQAFTYNKKDKTLNLTVTNDDPEVAEIMGVNEINLVFRQQ